MMENMKRRPEGTDRHSQMENTPTTAGQTIAGFVQYSNPQHRQALREEMRRHFSPERRSRERARHLLRDDQAAPKYEGELRRRADAAFRSVPLRPGGSDVIRRDTWL